MPGRTHTERHLAVYRRHSKWVGQWIKDRAKTSYELRRYAGSRLLDMGATIFEVRDFLRHRDVQTTQQWYAYRLQNRRLRTSEWPIYCPFEDITMDLRFTDASWWTRKAIPRDIDTLRKALPAYNGHMKSGSP